MSGLPGALSGMGVDFGWLAAATGVASIVFGACARRYRNAYLEARNERENYRDLIGNLSEGIYRCALDGRLLRVNRALAELNGYDDEGILLSAVGTTPGAWYVEPGRRDKFLSILERKGRVIDFVSEVHRYRTGERIWITESARLVRQKKTGQPLFYEGSVREITETAQRLKLEEMFQKLTTQLPGGLFQLVRRHDGQFSIPYVSSSFRSICGVDAAAAFPPPEEFLTLVDADDRERFTRSLRQSGAQMQPWDCEFRATTLTDQERWLRVTASPEAIEDGIIWHGYLTDISVRKRHEMRVEKLAYFDSLTGLPNRRLFMDRLSRALQAYAQRGGYGALLYVDLDNFKPLNDTMGHDVGDGFLAQVAGRLSTCVRTNDTVARIGGDEFVIVLERLGDDHGAATRNAILVANKVLDSLRQEFDLGQMRYRSSASIGVVVFDGSQARPDDLLKNADLAMYEAKACGRNGMALFDPTHLNREAERFRLVTQLREAIDREQLELEFQPQMDETATIRGVEALIRWHHPEHGTLFPASFVPIAEQYGLTEVLSDFVLERAVATLVRWKRDRATAHLSLAVNVDVPAIDGERFVPFLRELVTRNDIDPALLTLEVTERVMAKDNARVARRMNEIKSLGVRLSLDDFGTGYSSLALLKQLPFDELKIDGSFVTDIEKSEGDRALVKMILAMARTLGLKAVAEHVETTQQESFLKAFGCDGFQGWHYSPSLTEEELLSFIGCDEPASAVVAFPASRRKA